MTRDMDISVNSGLTHRTVLCQPSLHEERATTATDVDHIQSKSRGGSDELTHLQALCSKCHRLKSVRDRLG